MSTTTETSMSKMWQTDISHKATACKTTEASDVANTRIDTAQAQTQAQTQTEKSLARSSKVRGRYGQQQMERGPLQAHL